VANKKLMHIVANKLQLQWAPQQIAGWLKQTYFGDESYQVSHETIYRSLFIQARGALKKELTQHLRRTRIMRRSRHHTQNELRSFFVPRVERGFILNDSVKETRNGSSWKAVQG